MQRRRKNSWNIKTSIPEFAMTMFSVTKLGCYLSLPPPFPLPLAKILRKHSQRLNVTVFCKGGCLAKHANDVPNEVSVNQPNSPTSNRKCVRMIIWRCSGFALDVSNTLLLLLIFAKARLKWIVPVSSDICSSAATFLEAILWKSSKRPNYYLFLDSVLQQFRFNYELQSNWKSRTLKEFSTHVVAINTIFHLYDWVLVEHTKIMK